MGRGPQYYIPSFVEIGQVHVVLQEKIFEGFLAYMGMVAIMVILPSCRQQIFLSPTHGGSTPNLALIGQAVSEKMFEHCERRTTTMD